MCSMQAASHEAMEASIAVCLQKSGSGAAAERDADSAVISDYGAAKRVAQIPSRSASGSGAGCPLQMTNVQVELAQEIASYMKATHSDRDQVARSRPPGTVVYS